MNPASSAWFGEQISTYGKAFVQFRSSVGVHKSGTGSQMNSGFSAYGFAALRFLRIPVTRSIQRVGEQTMWKDFENRRVGVRAFSSRRSFGVVYLKARFWFESYPFQPRVVRREGSVRIRTEVSQVEIWEEMVEGKSEPASIIQETVRESGGGEKRRAPRAENAPPPPRMSKTGGFGGR